jgi:hypothetical protein
MALLRSEVLVLIRKPRSDLSQHEHNGTEIRSRQKGKGHSKAPNSPLERDNNYSLLSFGLLLNANAVDTPAHLSPRALFYCCISWYRRTFLLRYSSFPEFQRSRLWIQRLLLLYPIDSAYLELFVQSPQLFYQVAIPEYYEAAFPSNCRLSERERDQLWSHRTEALIPITTRLLHLTETARSDKPKSDEI